MRASTPFSCSVVCSFSCFVLVSSTHEPSRPCGFDIAVKGRTECNIGLALSSKYLAILIADSILCSIEAQNAFHLNYSTSSFRYPCLVTTYSLSPSLPWVALQRTSGAPGSLELTGGEYKT